MRMKKKKADVTLLSSGFGSLESSRPDFGLRSRYTYFKHLNLFLSVSRGAIATGVGLRVYLIWVSLSVASGSRHSCRKSAFNCACE